MIGDPKEGCPLRLSPEPVDTPGVEPAEEIVGPLETLWLTRDKPRSRLLLRRR